jgi:diaminohydroxyphosphoribosylaminopyrimidine deaminase/5-amino-6-(5-phosphoribosylamino)uracil reductase
VAAGDGGPVWVTGPEARAYAHLLRARADAILVGAGTVIADDPELTCRLPGLTVRSPDRIVLDTRLRTSPTAKVYRQGATKPRVWVAAALDVMDVGAAHGDAMLLDAGSMDGGSLDIEGLLATLARNGLTRLLVEGGPTVWYAFLAAGLVDEVCLVVGNSSDAATIPVITGDRDAYFSRYKLLPVASRQRSLGADQLLVYRRESP